MNYDRASDKRVPLGMMMKALSLAPLLFSCKDCEDTPWMRVNQKCGCQEKSELYWELVKYIGQRQSGRQQEERDVS